jgi:protein-disulfide isomerase
VRPPNEHYSAESAWRVAGRIARGRAFIPSDQRGGSDVHTEHQMTRGMLRPFDLAAGRIARIRTIIAATKRAIANVLFERDRAPSSTRLARIAAALIGLVMAGHVVAQAGQPAPIDPELVNRIKDAVVKELRDSGALDRAIDDGVERYVTRQREAAARSEQERANASADKVRPVAMPRDHVRGNPDAPVSLIEYSDFECPFCKGFHETAKQVVEAYGGKVNWVYRHFPLDFHNPAAQREAEAAECVAELKGNDAFWRYADLLFARTRSNGGGVPEADLPTLASSVGVDRARFGECLRGNRKAARVKEDLDEGMAIGITGTPGNILRNNRTGKVIARSGALPLALLRPEIDELLK